MSNSVCSKVGALIVLIGTLASGEAFAEATSAALSMITPFKYNEGPGVMLTDSLVVHPGILLEGRYDSNPAYADTGVKGAPYLRIVGHFDISTRSPQRLTDAEGRVARPTVEFRLKSAFGYREYFSSNQAIVEQRGLEVDAGLNLKLFPGRVFSFELVDDFERSVVARDFSTPLGAGSDVTLKRDLNIAGARIHVTPGGGRLVFTLGYNLVFDAYENTGFENLNKLVHEAIFDAKWKLLPKTAIVLEVTQGFVNYFERDSTSPQHAQNLDSKPLRVLVGLSGLITARIAAIVRVGYGNGFYDSDSKIVGAATTKSSYSSVLGHAEVNYMFAPSASIRLGFEHDFQDSTYGNYYTDEHGYLSYDHWVAARFLVHLEGNYRYRQYKGFAIINDFNPGLTDLTSLNAHLVNLGFGVDYKIREWIYVGVAYELHLRGVTSTVPLGHEATTAGLSDFVRHQVISKFGLSY